MQEWSQQKAQSEDCQVRIIAQHQQPFHMQSGLDPQVRSLFPHSSVGSQTLLTAAESGSPSVIFYWICQ